MKLAAGILLGMLVLNAVCTESMQVVDKGFTSSDCTGDAVDKVLLPAPMCYSLNSLPAGFSVSNVPPSTRAVKYECGTASVGFAACDDAACASCAASTPLLTTINTCNKIENYTQVKLEGVSLDTNALNGVYELLPEQLNGAPLYRHTTTEAYMYYTQSQAVGGGWRYGGWNIDNIKGNLLTWMYKRSMAQLPFAAEPAGFATFSWTVAGANAAGVKTTAVESSNQGLVRNGVAYFSGKTVCDSQAQSSVAWQPSQVFDTMAMLLVLNFLW